MLKPIQFCKDFEERKKTDWFSLAFKLKGSVVLKIYKRVILSGLFGFIISLLYYLDLPVSKPIFANIVPSIVLGLLLVIRTNTAYDRFWEGRKLWSDLINNVRNLVWQIWTMIGEIEPEDRAKKIAILNLLACFPLVMKLYLRGEPVNEEVEKLVSREQFLQLQKINNQPLQVVSWISTYLQEQYQRGNNALHFSHVVFIQSSLKNLVECIGNCERILTTPLPLAYTIHLKQLLLIYCLFLPFELVQDLGWTTGVFVALVSFTLLGIEEIGIEIENPFGYDDNDIPLDEICTQFKQNIKTFIETQQ